MERLYNTIITFNDDSHRSIVFVNGYKVGSLEEELNTLSNFFIVASASAHELPLMTRTIELLTLPVSDELALDISDFFWSAAGLTPEDEQLELTGSWEELTKSK